MNRFTIHCTEEQTKKALELGAPIELSNCAEKVFKFWDGFTYIIPTAEQMIGWLLEQNGIVSIFVYKDALDDWSWGFETENKYSENIDSIPSRKEATLAAIDAVLKYLEENIKIKL